MPPHEPSPQPPRQPDGQDDQPALPARSQEDTDAAWGERPEPDDDERLRQDRPPHWEIT